jgi:hypothetical protein
VTVRAAPAATARSAGALTVQSLAPLVAGRAICGVGAGTIPLGFAIARDCFPAEQLDRAVGLLSTTFGIGMGLGLALSGVILDHLPLAWLFWPGALAGPTAIAVRLVIARPAPAARVGVDWLGAALLCSGLVAAGTSASAEPTEGACGAALALGFAASVAASLLTLRLPEPTPWRST